MLVVKTGLAPSVIRGESYTDIMDLVHYINEVTKQQNKDAKHQNTLYNND